ncbi:MAG: MFS transporter [Actinomycetes bacterium]
MTYDTAAPAQAPGGSRPSGARFGLPSLVWALAAGQFVSRAGGVPQSFLVLFLTQERQLSPATAGAVVATVGAGTAVSLLLGGWLSDRIGRRHTMLAGFFGTAVALVALGSADTTAAIWTAAVGVGLMAELSRPAGSATIADLPDPRDRIRAYGLLFWASNLGFSVASVTAGILAEHGYGILFRINAAAAVVAALIAWRRVPETRPPITQASRRSLLPVLLRDRLMMTMVGIYVVYFALFLQAFSTLPLMMAADGDGPKTFGLVLALNGAAIVVLQPLAVRLFVDRDRSALLATSMLLVGLGGGLGAVVGGTAAYTGSVLIWTLGEIGVAVMFGATFADLAPADLRGGYMGVAATTWSLGGVLGPLVGTALLDYAGRPALAAASVTTGMALFAIQRAVAPALRCRAGGPDARARGVPCGEPDPAQQSLVGA